MNGIDWDHAAENIDTLLNTVSASSFKVLDFVLTLFYYTEDISLLGIKFHLLLEIFAFY